VHALIIAGGQGERLRPYTWDRPKPMVEVAGRPILEHQVRWLKQYGVTHVVILCHYKAEVVQDYFGDGSRFGLRISYTVEEKPLGRGGALKLGHTLLPSDADPIVALNGDILTNQPLDRLVAYHRRKGAVATIMLVPLKSPYGIVRMGREGRIREFVEKPRLSFWINGGVYVLSPAIFPLLPDRGDHETTTFPLLAQEGKLYGYRSRAYWRAVDTIKDLREADEEVRALGL
jgi:NDP-sugar pyrophosphorylase family protein